MEKSSLPENDPTVEVNDSIDEVIFSGEDSVLAVPADMPDISMKDDHPKLQKRRKRLREKKQKIEEESNKIAKEIADEQKRTKRLILRQKLLYFISVKAIVDLIQYFEELLMVVFIDTPLLCILFS